MKQLAAALPGQEPGAGPAPEPVEGAQ